MWAAIPAPTIKLPLVLDALHPGRTWLLEYMYIERNSLQTSQSLSAYTVLCEKYKQFIDRDPQYLEYLDKIGQHFFGVPAPVKPRPGGMFSGSILMLCYTKFLNAYFVVFRTF